MGVQSESTNPSDADSHEPDDKPSPSELAPDRLSPQGSEHVASLEHFWELFQQNGLIKVFFALAVLVNAIWIYKSATERYNQNDFAHYYASSQLYLADQDDLYRTDLRPEYSKLGWEKFREPIYYATNPPSLIQFFAVYARLPPRAAHLAWMLTQLAALCVAIRLTYEAVRDRLSGQGFILVVTVFLFLPFVKAHIVYSQVQLLLFALVLLGFRFLQKGQGWLGCLFVVGAALIKLYPAVLLPWFVWRSGSTIGTRLMAGIVSAVALIAGIWLTDISMWKDFMEVARPQIANWVSASQCFTLSSLAVHLGAIASGTQASQVFFQFGIGVGLLLIGSFYVWVWRRGSRGSNSENAHELVILILLMLFCGATCWWHYLVFLLFPMAVAATDLRDHFNGRKLTGCAIVAVLLMPLTSSADFGDLPTLLLLFAPMFSMISMTIYLIVCSHRRSVGQK